MCKSSLMFHPVWPDWMTYWTLGNFLKPLATINLLKSSHILKQIFKGVKINHFSSEIIFGQHLVIFSGHTDQRKLCLSETNGSRKIIESQSSLRLNDIDFAFLQQALKWFFHRSPSESWRLISVTRFGKILKFLAIFMVDWRLTSVTRFGKILKFLAIFHGWLKYLKN